MLRIGLFVLGGIALLAAVPVAAVAQSSVPPGDSEVDQYVPTLPDSEGDKTVGGAPGGGRNGGAGGGNAGTGDGRTVGTGDGRTVVPSSTAESLRAAGSDGKGALSFVKQAAPNDAGGGHATGRDGGKGSAGAGGSDSGAGADGSVASADESVAGAVLEGLSSGRSGGMGILLPILLGVVAGAGTFMLLRRRLSGHPRA